MIIFDGIGESAKRGGKWAAIAFGSLGVVVGFCTGGIGGALILGGASAAAAGIEGVWRGATRKVEANVMRAADQKFFGGKVERFLTNIIPWTKKKDKNPQNQQPANQQEYIKHGPLPTLREEGKKEYAQKLSVPPEESDPIPPHNLPREPQKGPSGRQL